jgi:hypothetical protein
LRASGGQQRKFALALIVLVLPGAGWPDMPRAQLRTGQRWMPRAQVRTGQRWQFRAVIFGLPPEFRHPCQWGALRGLRDSSDRKINAFESKLT